jgi:hypothetical protein
VLKPRFLASLHAGRDFMPSAATAVHRARRQVIAGSAIFAFAFGAAVMRTLDTGSAAPREHDEFSYLLGADTFRASRLTNPPHRLADSFDTFHVLQRPTYASKYPPAHALILAIGWILGGHPIVGVWIGFAVMSVCLYWMLIAWIGPRWAISGSVAVASWLALTYWSHTYWGGAIAAAGGALVYGAALRLCREPRPICALIMGTGLAILANSRPFEGLLVSIPPLFTVLRSLARRDTALSYRQARDCIVCLAVVGITTVAAMGLYNHAVTGHVGLMPYLAYEREHAPAPEFVWQRDTEKTAVDPRRLALQKWALADFDSQRGFRKSMSSAAVKLSKVLDFIVPLAVAYPIILVPLVRRQIPFIGVAAGGVAMTCLGISMTTWFQPHYFAPAIAPFVALYFGSLRLVPGVTRRFKLLGPSLIVVTLAIWIVPALVSMAVHLPGLPSHRQTPDWATARIRLADSLAADGRYHVLLVSYPPNYSPHSEWVFNGSDIDGQSVIWARDLGADRNLALTNQYVGRTISLLEVRADSPYYHLRSDSLIHPSERRDTARIARLVAGNSKTRCMVDLELWALIRRVECPLFP